MVKLILIDDNKSDLELFGYVLSTFKDVDIKLVDDIPKIEDLRAFDGIILDNNVNHKMDGLTFAHSISEAYPLKPIMLLTGDKLDRDARTVVDEIAHKSDQVRFHVAMINFLRSINRVKLASKVAC